MDEASASDAKTKAIPGTAVQPTLPRRAAKATVAAILRVEDRRSNLVFFQFLRIHDCEGLNDHHATMMSLPVHRRLFGCQ